MDSMHRYTSRTSVSGSEPATLEKLREMVKKFPPQIPKRRKAVGHPVAFQLALDEIRKAGFTVTEGEPSNHFDVLGVEVEFNYLMPIFTKEGKPFILMMETEARASSANDE